MSSSRAVALLTLSVSVTSLIINISFQCTHSPDLRSLTRPFCLSAPTFTDPESEVGAITLQCVRIDLLKCLDATLFSQSKAMICSVTVIPDHLDPLVIDTSD